MYQFSILLFKISLIKTNIVALECKPANSHNFTGQRKDKQNLILFLWKETIFHIFFSTIYDRNFKLQFYLDDVASLFLSNGINMLYLIKNRFSRFTL